MLYLNNIFKKLHESEMTLASLNEHINLSNKKACF